MTATEATDGGYKWHIEEDTCKSKIHLISNVLTVANGAVLGAPTERTWSFRTDGKTNLSNLPLCELTFAQIRGVAAYNPTTDTTKSIRFTIS